MKRIQILLISFIFIIVSIVTPTITTAQSQFPDVPNDYWAKAEIEYLTGLKIINGYQNGLYGPLNNVTRVQAAVMISRALQLNLNDRPNPGFKDIPINHYAYKEIAAVVDEGIFLKEENFLPQQGLTRGEMAIALAEAYNLTGTFKGKIEDVAPNTATYRHVNALAANNITVIYEDNTYRPHLVVNRAQFAVFFARVLEPHFRPAPHFPLNLWGEALSSEEIILNWDSVVGADFYYLYFSDDLYADEYYYFENEDGTKKQLQWFEDYSASLYNLDGGTTVYFKVTAVRGGKESNYSPVIAVTTPPSVNNDISIVGPLSLIADDGTFIGNLTTDEYATDGIYNEYGTYGSEYSSLSIWNEYGTYGSEYSQYSPFNEYTSTPPKIVDGEGNVLGRVTINEYIADGIHPYELYDILLELGF